MTLAACSTRPSIGRILAAALVAAAIMPAPAAAQRKQTAPEVFNARATVPAAGGRGDAYVTIRVDRYSADKDLETMERQLKDGGSAAFVLALKQAPVVGRFEVGSQSFAIRWARQRENDQGRVITLVVDAPVYFVGGGVPGAASREGFDVAVIRLEMHSSGLGEGTMATAAKVKPGERSDVEVQAYEGQPVKLMSIMRKIS